MKKACFFETIDLFSPIMRLDIDTRDVAAVTAEIQRLYQIMFPDGDAEFVPRAVGWTQACFTGRHPGYQAIDARFHDFEHTLQGTLCQARLLFGRHRAGAEPRITQSWFELLELHQSRPS